MTEARAATAVPVSQTERIAEVDVLRGVALFGVLTMNFVGFAGAFILSTETQLAALPTAAVDRVTTFLVEWLIGDKANTLFATLFGLGFYIQLRRSEGKPGFVRRFSRRLFWLLVFGWFNALFLWIWDILNLYALAGFFLLLMRNWQARTLAVFGLVAAMYSDKLQQAIIAAAGLPPLVPHSQYADAAVLARQQIARTGSYPEIVASFAQWTWTEWIAGGLLIAWIVYALGRFALGAAIGRSGLLDAIPRYLPLLRRIAWIALPLGLVAAFLARALGNGLIGSGEGWRMLGGALRSPAALILVAGYASAIVVAYQQGAGRKFFGWFGPVGQMALTNYLVQGFIYAFVLFGVGPGLALAGRIGSTAVLAICIAFFAAQIVVSRLWMARYRFGPMEWLWRWLTYGGARPPMRRG